MNEKELIAELARSVGEAPSQAEVFAVRQYSLEELNRRMKRLLGTIGKRCDVNVDRADWVRGEQRTLVRLPMGGRAVLYHASGAMEVRLGLAPMEHLFGKVPPREALIETVTSAAERLEIAEWAGPGESLEFERLWQIKAAAADHERVIEPVLCRIVGAYRQTVGSLPVLGPASVALKLAAGGAVDGVSMVLRPSVGSALEWPKLLGPEEAATRIVAELRRLMGRSNERFLEHARPRGMTLGYLGLGKRKAQDVLAPHYVASIDLEGEEAQGVQLVVAATDETYLPLCRVGAYPPTPEAGRKTVVPLTSGPKASIAPFKQAREAAAGE